MSAYVARLRPLLSAALNAHGTNASPDGFRGRTHINEPFSACFGVVSRPPDGAFFLVEKLTAESTWKATTLECVGTNSTRADEGRKCRTRPAKKNKARTVVGREEECQLRDPGPEIRRGGSGRSRANIIYGMKLKKEKSFRVGRGKRGRMRIHSSQVTAGVTGPWSRMAPCIKALFS